MEKTLLNTVKVKGRVWDRDGVKNEITKEKKKEFKYMKYRKKKKK